MVLRTFKHFLVGLSQGLGMTFERRGNFSAHAVFPASATIKR
jgi:hypothetical protein